MTVPTGAQWASRRIIPASIIKVVALLLAFGAIFAVARLSPTAAATSDVLMSRSEILTRPTSGAAWAALKARADSSIGTPDISNQDESADVTVLAKALVYARIGGAGYRADVVAALKRAVGTESGGRTLALGRNLPGYVIAADLIDLDLADPSFDRNTFRPWLRSLFTKTLDGRTLVSTHEDRPNNWGTHAGAARVAAAAYLGDDAQIARAAVVFRGYLGDRNAYAGFKYGDLGWQCDPARPVGINPAGCSRSGIVLDGVLPDDMRRGGGLRWPPSSTGYPWEGLQGAVLQAELLRVQGYDAWSWSGKALLRAAKFLNDRARWAAVGDDEWQPWLIDRRYGTAYRDAPPARTGKNFGFTDWLYGPPGTSSGPPVPTVPPQPVPTPVATPVPTPTRTPTPTPTSTPTPTPTGTAAANQPTTAPDPTPTDGGEPTDQAGPTPEPTPAPTPEPTEIDQTPEPTPTPPPTTRPQSAQPPEVSRPVVELSATSSVPMTGVPVVVDWELTEADDDLRRFELEVRIGDGDWSENDLTSVTASSSRRTVPVGTTFRFRVRAIDDEGRVGDWETSRTYRASVLSDSSSAIDWAGSWALASHASYVGGRAHWSAIARSTSSLSFDGDAVAWFGPAGTTRGKARVYIDGRLVATIDQYSTTFRAREIAFARNLEPGDHTMRIETVGTSGRPTVGIDGMYVLATP